jgi:cytoskeletal protein RodZ
MRAERSRFVQKFRAKDPELIRKSMKYLFSVALALCLTVRLHAQTAENPPTAAASTPATSAEVEALREEVRSLKELVETLQQQVKTQQQPASENSNPPALPENPEPVTADTSAPATPSPSAPALFPTTDSAVVASAPSVNANGTGTFPTTDDSVTTATQPTVSSSDAGSSLTQPLPLLGGGNNKNYMNISFDSVFALAASSERHLDRLEVGDHDPQQRGFNARNAEIALDGAVDPYFEGFANIVLKLDNDNETEIELEEAFLQTTTLPYGLQVKAGQFFDAFGRMNATHPHTWEFADSPLVSGRLLGPDGLRGVGAQFSWTLPTPWYSQLLFAVQNGRGGTAYSFRNSGEDGVFFDRLTIDRDASALHDMLYVPRFETSFNPSDTQTILLGASGALGMNDTGADNHTQIYGADFLYKWKSSRAEGGFPFVKWQTEAMYRRFQAGRGVEDLFPVEETFRDWGLYSQLVWGFKKGWVAGLRGDYVHMQESAFTDDDTRQSRSRISANLTWYPTEFSKIRLQYNHDFLEENDFLASRDADSVFLQFEFILGAHGAHKF